MTQRRCIIHAFVYIQECITTYIHINLNVYSSFTIKRAKNGPHMTKEPHLLKGQQKDF